MNVYEYAPAPHCGEWEPHEVHHNSFGECPGTPERCPNEQVDE